MANVYLALPVGANVSAGLLWTVLNCSAGKHRPIARMMGGHFPCFCFNRLYAEALNHSRWGKQKDWGHAYFAMSHGDIKADDAWIDTLIDEMDRVDADVMSTVIPIKDGKGLTSTGIMDRPDGRTRRLTMTEIFDLPETFSIRDTVLPDATLAINEGLFVCRWTESWVTRFPGFSLDDGIINDDGNFRAHVFSEDWKWAQWLATQKRDDGAPLRIFATRKVGCGHYDGSVEFSNREPWGDWLTDLGDEPDGGHQE